MSTLETKKQAALTALRNRSRTAVIPPPRRGMVQPVHIPSREREVSRVVKENTPWGLTRKELCVIREAVSGKSIPVLSRQMKISTNTVKTHLANVYKKMKVNGRVQAAVLLASSGYYTLPPLTAAQMRALNLLSSMDKRVLYLLAKGYTTEQIAEEIGKTLAQTVVLRDNISKKTNSRSRLSQALFALQAGIHVNSF